MGTEPGVFDGVDLDCPTWKAEPVSVDRMASSLFDDVSVFPAGSCTLDSALIMRELPVRWIALGHLAALADARTGGA